MTSFVPSWDTIKSLIDQNTHVVLVKKEIRSYKYIIVKIRLICEQGNNIETIELSESLIKITKTEDCHILDDGPWLLDLVNKKQLGYTDALKEFLDQNYILQDMKLSKISLLFQYLGSYLAVLQGEEMDIFEQDEVGGITILVPKYDDKPIDITLQQIKLQIEQYLKLPSPISTVPVQESSSFSPPSLTSTSVSSSVSSSASTSTSSPITVSSTSPR